MELRHLETLLAVVDEGSFTGAADALATVQSNVSEQVRQVEEELGVQLFIRGRKGAEPTEYGGVVLERARRIRREVEAMQVDVSMLQGLESGESAFGIVGTASRWVVPPLVSELQRRAPGVQLRITESASERLLTELLAGELGQVVVTEPVNDRRLVAETILEEQLVAVVAADMPFLPRPVPLEAVNALGLVLPPRSNPLRREIEAAAAEQHLELDVTVEVEGIRLVADLVAAGAGASVMPETALPREPSDIRAIPIVGMRPRRLALVTVRDSRLSLADTVVYESLLAVLAERKPSGTTVVRKEDASAAEVRRYDDPPEPSGEGDHE